MSNYRRFITYLHQYEKGEKQQPCGYARVEQRQDQGKIEFYIKNCGATDPTILPCFFADRGQVQIPIGELTVERQNANGSFTFLCGNLGRTTYHFQDMSGILVPLAKDLYLLSQWTDEPICWEALTRETDELVPSKPEELEFLDTDPEPRPIAPSSLTTESLSASTTDTLSTSSADTSSSPTDDSAALSAAAGCTCSLQENIQSLRIHRPFFYPFCDDRETWAVAAQLRDIRQLPQQHWPLGNNSFVLRSYFRYGSLLMGYMPQEDCCFLGVPGIYHTQEKMIADMFGFLDFRGKHRKEVKPGDFGYWYRRLDVVS